MNINGFSSEIRRGRSYSDGIDVSDINFYFE